MVGSKLHCKWSKSSGRIFHIFYRWIRWVSKIYTCRQRHWNAVVEQMQNFLHGTLEATDTSTHFMYGRSTANQRIENWWCFLRRQCTEFWISFFQELRQSGLFNGEQMEQELIRFVFTEMIQVTGNVWFSHIYLAKMFDVLPLTRQIWLHSIKSPRAISFFSFSKMLESRLNHYFYIS